MPRQENINLKEEKESRGIQYLTQLSMDHNQESN